MWFRNGDVDSRGRIEGMNDALARLRKCCGCVAIVFQSVEKVKQLYGEGAQTIIENCGNLLLLRAGASEDGGTAKLASELIGGREVERDDVSRSRTRGRFTTRSVSRQTRRSVEDMGVASEIMQLKNLEGFVKRAQNARRIRRSLF